MRQRIYIGSLSDPDYYFENDQIFSTSTVQNVALVGQELSVDSFTATVADSPEGLYDIYHFRSSDGQEIVTAIGEVYALDVGAEAHVSDLIKLEKNTPVWYYQDNTLVGQFFVESIKRVGANRYQLNSISAVGTLEEKYHGGGLFLASTFGTILQHILAKDLHGTGEAVISYQIDEDVAQLPVSGWLPYDTKRNNLYRLIFATGVNIIKNMDGSPRFTFIYTAPENADTVSGDIYNEGDVQYDPPYTNVVVFEHTYTPLLSSTPVTLFDNTTGEVVTQEEIWFGNAPIIQSTIEASEGLIVVSATENSAVVTGSGKLTGIPYLHETRAVHLGDSSASEEKTIRVTDATMVNILNSENLLQRLFAFYCPSPFIQRIRNGIVYSGERCGRAYSFRGPFKETTKAFLSSITLNSSSFNKAECEWYTNYTPAGQAGLYQHCVILAPVWDEENEQWIYTGTWTAPENVTEIKVVEIGGGTGGGSGWPGENGGDARTYTNIEQTADLSAIWYGAEGGDGGAGGAGGNPGRVKSFVLAVSPGDEFTYTLGQGGIGGAATGFKPDTVSELRAALENENPGTSYTDAQIGAMIAQEGTTWNGSPNVGTDGTATSFSDGTDTWSTADSDAYVPTGAVYDPIGDTYYAYKGNTGIKGGKGGARKIQSGGVFNWVTDGEDVTGDDGTVYHGGQTGRPYTSVSGLPEANLIAYGGNGAGAAVGLDRADHPHMDGGSDQSATWEVTTD